MRAYLAARLAHDHMNRSRLVHAHLGIALHSESQATMRHRTLPHTKIVDQFDILVLRIHTNLVIQSRTRTLDAIVCTLGRSMYTLGLGLIPNMTNIVHD